MKKLITALTFLCVIGLGVSHADINKGLIAHWSFDLCDGTDSALNGYDGVVSSSPTCVTGLSGMAMDFKGGNIKIDKDLQFDKDYEEYTITLWLKMEKGDDFSLTNEEYTILKRERIQYVDEGWEITYKRRYCQVDLYEMGECISGYYNFQDYDGSKSMLSTLDEESGLNQWVFIMVRRTFNEKSSPSDDAEYEVEFSLNMQDFSYVDDSGWRPEGEDSSLIIKGGAKRDSKEQGITLDDIRIYDRYITDDEANQLFNMNSSPVTTTTTINPDATTTTTTVGEDKGNCPATEIYGTDSEEANLLRAFRDIVLKNDPAGRELIKMYYAFSPLIVQMMNDDSFKDIVKENIELVLEEIN